MNNPQDEYNRLHDHAQALGRERDWLQREVKRLTDELIQELAGCDCLANRSIAEKKLGK